MKLGRKQSAKLEVNMEMKKKAMTGEMITNLLLWILFFVLVSIGIGFLIKKISA